MTVNGQEFNISNRIGLLYVLYMCIIGPVGRVFTNGPETWVQSQVASYQRLKNGI